MTNLILRDRDVIREVPLRKRLINMKKRFSKVMLAILFASVLLIVIMTPLAKAQSQTLSLFPGEGPPNSSVTASLGGFTSGTAVDLVWG